VVEENNDGGVHGKCRVRILGIHPVNAQRTGINKGVSVGNNCIDWKRMNADDYGFYDDC
jgi:hypothetical protein